MRPFNRVAAWTAAQAYAVQALSRGDATPEQQRVAHEWIVTACSEAFAINDAPDAHAMAFCAGRQSVGREITSLVGLNVESTLAEIARETKARGKNG